MSVVIHRSIIVTSWARGVLSEAHDIAKSKCGLVVSNIVVSPIEAYHSFMISTSGSKKGWQDQFDHDEKIDNFKEYVKKYDNDDGSTPLEICDVNYGNYMDEDDR